MKRFLVLAFLAVILLGSTGCVGCTRIGPGYSGIKVNMAGGSRGVQDTPVVTGWVTYNVFSESIIEYPNFVQTAKWTASATEGKPVDESITFTNKDSMLISADVSLSYSLQKEKTPHFYEKFRSDDIEAFTHGYLRNVARDTFNETAGHYSVEQIMGDNGTFLAEVRKRLQAEVEPVGVKIEQFGFIGAPRPPAAVVNAINAKVQATQSAIKAENELRQATAEANKAVATAEGQARSRIAVAEGEAKSNKVLAESITPQLLQLRALQIQEQAISKWSGAVPTFMGGGSDKMLFNLPVK